MGRSFFCFLLVVVFPLTTVLAVSQRACPLAVEWTGRARNLFFFFGPLILFFDVFVGGAFC